MTQDTYRVIGDVLLSVVWPAVNGHGERVPPGTYVYRIAVDAAAGADARTGLIAVAY